jgi:hypothetical protein
MTPEFELDSGRRAVPERRFVLANTESDKARALGYGLRGAIVGMSP